MPTVSDGTHEQDVIEIENLLTHGLSKQLAFKSSMEEKFQNFYRHHVAITIRQGITVCFVAFAFMGCFGFLFIPTEAFWTWISLYLLLCIVFLWLFRIPYSKDMQKHHQAYLSVGLGSGAMVVMLGGFLVEPVLQGYINYTFIFVLMVIYTTTILSFKKAVFTGFGSGSIAILIAGIFQLNVHWPTFCFLFLTSNVIGLCICYQNERWVRQNFLQQTLLAIEKIQLHEMGEKLTALSRQDGLTQIANRRHFDESYKKEWLRGYRHHQVLSVIFIDVDFYKRYNDAYGHQQGDQCLINLAQCIHNQVSRPEDLVARYGGEEFILLLPATDEHGAIKIAERIHKAVADLKLEHQASEVNEFVTVSIGIASTIPRSEDTKLTLIRRADAALYHAKSSGRNCWRLAPSLRMINDEK